MPKFKTELWDSTEDIYRATDAEVVIVGNLAALGERLEALVTLQERTNELLEKLYETTPEGRMEVYEQMRQNPDKVRQLFPVSDDSQELYGF